MTRYRPTSEAPRDGTEVLIKLDLEVRAFWCPDLKRWVLSRPLLIESRADPQTWREPGRIKRI